MYLITGASKDFLAFTFRAYLAFTDAAANAWVNVPVKASEFVVAGFAEAASIKATVGPFCVAPCHVKSVIHLRQHEEVFAFILFADDTDAVFASAAITCRTVFKTAALLSGWKGQRTCFEENRCRIAHGIGNRTHDSSWAATHRDFSTKCFTIRFLGTREMHATGIAIAGIQEACRATASLATAEICAATYIADGGFVKMNHCAVHLFNDFVHVTVRQVKECLPTYDGACNGKLTQTMPGFEIAITSILDGFANPTCKCVILVGKPMTRTTTLHAIL